MSHERARILRWFGYRPLLLVFCFFSAIPSISLAGGPRCHAMDGRKFGRDSERITDLVKLAQLAGCNPTEAEKKLLRKTHNGEVADYSVRDKSKGDLNDLSKAGEWPASREIGADLIRWLCVNPEAVKLVDPRGIYIIGARIEGNLDLIAATVPFPLSIIESSLAGGISARVADLKMLILDGTWSGPIQAHGATVRGSLFLRNGFHAAGEVRLSRTTIGASLEGGGGTFSNPSGDALDAEGASVAGDVFLQDWTTDEGRGLPFNSDGEVNLQSATVGGDLYVSGTFHHPGKNALELDGVRVGGDAIFKNLNSDGDIRLNTATVGRDLSFEGDELAPGIWVHGEGVKIGRRFWWKDTKNLKAPSEGLAINLDLIDTTTGTFLVDSASWPRSGQLFLDGFRYDRIQEVGQIAGDVGQIRIEWLGRQTVFSTQPYTQLARVLAESGNDPASRDVLIAMEDAISTREKSRWVQLWRSFLRRTVAYGYKPWYAVWWGAGFLALGFLIFRIGYWAGLIRPNDKEAYHDFENSGHAPASYQRFNALIYTLDTLIPVIEFGHKNLWIPNAGLSPTRFRQWLASGLLVWSWLYIALGWALSVSVLAAVAKVMRGSLGG